MRRSKTINLKLDACDLQERGQLRNSRYDDTGITLDDRVLVEDDAPAIGQPQGVVDRAWFERLQRGIVLRKEFEPGAVDHSLRLTNCWRIILYEHAII